MQKSNGAVWGEQLSLFHIPRWSELPDIDLYMDQVIGQLDKYLAPLSALESEHSLTASMVNNYVKMNLLPSPVKKRYGRIHLARLVAICLLKQVFSIPQVKLLLDGHLSQADPADLSAAYDAFCAAQEAAYTVTAARAAQPEHSALGTVSLSLEMAVLAGASKALAQKLLAEQPDSAEPASCE